MKTLFLVVSILIPLSAYSQDNRYQPGYVVKGSHKDSVHISIKQSRPNKGLAAIKNQEKVTLLSTDLDTLAFSDGRTYVSAQLPVSKKRLFAQLLFKGKISLLLLNDSDYNNLLFLQKDGQVFELPENSKQRGLLAFLMSDCNRVAEKLRAGTGKISSKTAVASLLESYHQCTSPKTEYKKYPLKRYSLEIGLLAGLGYSNFIRKSTASLTPEIGSSFSPLVGLFIEQRFSSSLSIQPEVGYINQRVLNDSLRHLVNQFNYSSYDIRLNKIQFIIP